MSTEKNILLNRLKKGTQAHKQNTLFTTLLTMIEGSDDIIQNNVKLLSAIIAAKDKAKNPENVPDEAHTYIEADSLQLQDMLCLHLMMAGVRAFPPSNERIRRYGIDLSADIADKDSLKNSAVSSIILGGNGMGKTSLFIAMETISMRHSYIADAHGYTHEAEQANFLKHALNQTDSPQIEFVSRDRKIHSYSRHDSLDVPPAFFCSIYDIQTLESHEANDLTKYILNQIGCGQVHELSERLRNLSEILNLLVEYSSISGKGKSLSSVEQQKRKKRREEIKDLISKRLGIPKMSLSQIYNNKWNQADLLRFKEVYDYLRDTLDEDLRKVDSIAKGTVPLIMNGFLEKDCSLEITYENLSFRIDLKVGPDSMKDTPRRYFNTFRFKLFVVALKTSLACSVKIIHRINFPMVLDDVFDASDFKHKHDIRKFIRDIMVSHDRALSKSRIDDSSMQLLFMSQDDMIAISAYQGVCDADIEKSDKRTLAKFCRLYPHKEIDTKADLMKVTTSDPNVCYHKIFNTIESNF